MIEVESNVKEGIDWINSQGEYNPYDFPQISTILRASGYKEAADWIDAHPVAYMDGISCGFEVVYIGGCNDSIINEYERYL